MEKFSLPQRQYVIPNQHKYAVGNIVLNTNNSAWNKHYGKEGTITKLLPSGTMYAAYDVKYADGSVVATSERSIQQLPEFECDVCGSVSSRYISCDRCDWTLCLICTHEYEGIPFCRECYAERVGEKVE